MDDGTNLHRFLQLVLHRLSDIEFPVRIEASNALCLLIYLEGADVTLLPILTHILHEYFRRIIDIGNDEVVGFSNFSRDPLQHHRGLSVKFTLSSAWWARLSLRSALPILSL